MDLKLFEDKLLTYFQSQKFISDGAFSSDKVIISDGAIISVGVKSPAERLKIFFWIMMEAGIEPSEDNVNNYLSPIGRHAAEILDKKRKDHDFSSTLVEQFELVLKAIPVCFPKSETMVTSLEPISPRAALVQYCSALEKLRQERVDIKKTEEPSLEPLSPITALVQFQYNLAIEQLRQERVAIKKAEESNRDVNKYLTQACFF